MAPSKWWASTIKTGRLWPLGVNRTLTRPETRWFTGMLPSLYTLTVSSLWLRNWSVRQDNPDAKGLEFY